MKSLIKSTLTSVVLILSFIAFAGEGDVAKVIILKGSVKAKLKDNSVVTLKKGDWLPEGAQVKTEAKSFVKLLFIDKSQMNLGPNSQMIINKFPKKKAGIITLMKGQLRSKVTKDYMQMDKSREKLYIKTKTAAMGVRGTDFEVSVVNGITATQLFEGALVVTSLGENFNPADLQKVFQKPEALTSIGAGQMAVFKSKAGPPAVLKIPENVMKEAAKSGGKKGDLKTLSDKKMMKKIGNNLLLPGTQKDDVANSSAGEDAGVVASGPNVVEEDGKVVKEEDEKFIAEGPKDGDPNGPGPDGGPGGPNPEGDGRGPAGDGNSPEFADGGPNGSTDDLGPPTQDECPLSGCGGGVLPPGPEFEGPNGPEGGPEFAGPLPEDPCALDPGLCEVLPEEGDICMINPELPQCGGGATSTNVQFNFTTQ